MGIRKQSEKSPALNDKYLFGTEAELANRAGPTGYGPGKDPEENAPSFEQIKPSSGGKNVNDMETGQTRSGDFKFSGGVGGK